MPSANGPPRTAIIRMVKPLARIEEVQERNGKRTSGKDIFQSGERKQNGREKEEEEETSGDEVSGSSEGEEGKEEESEQKGGKGHASRGFKNESAEEKRLRKKNIKEEKRLRRAQKKSAKLTAKSEALKGASGATRVLDQVSIYRY